MPTLPTTTPPAEPVFLVISKEMLNDAGLATVLSRLRLLSATREDTWRYRQMVSVSVDGYDNDPRALVDIPEVRAYLKKLIAQWPYWGYFGTPRDDTFKILVSCGAGSAFIGGGGVEIDGDKFIAVIQEAFGGMNELFDKHAFPEPDLEAQCQAFMACLADAGFPV